MPITLDYDTTEVYKLEVIPRYKDNFIYLVFLGDLHIGHKDCSLSFLQKAVTLIRRLSVKHEVVVILMGDLIETDKDYASQYMIEDVVERTKEQFATMLQHLSPISHLCQFALWGNHEERLIRDSKTKRALEMVGIDNLYEMILQKLNSKITVAQPQRGMLIKLICSKGYLKQEYDIRISHGAYGGYKRPELQTERESDNYPTASLIAMGHHHQKYWDEKIKLGLSDGRRAIYAQYWLGTGTFLGYPAYAERKSYPVNVMGCPIIKVYSDVQHLEYVNSPPFMPRFQKTSGTLPLANREMLTSIFFTGVPKDFKPNIQYTPCQKCGSTHIVKHGLQATKNGRTQVFQCQKCGYNTRKPQNPTGS